MPDPRLQHLTREQHRELAQALAEAARIVDRVAFRDRTIYARKLIQERLIDPPRTEWEATADPHDSPYPSVYYAGGKR